MSSRRAFLGYVASALWVAQADTNRDIALRIIRVSTRSEAEDILRRLETGGSFESLAKQFSTDPSSTNGGYIGKMSPSKLRPELRDALQQVRVSQNTGVVQTPAGYV